MRNLWKYFLIWDSGIYGNNLSLGRGVYMDGWGGAGYLLIYFLTGKVRW